MPLRPTSTVHPINFPNLSGTEFERLVFAYLCRRWPWKEITWIGEGGADGGRDIRGVRETDYGKGELVVAACANWKTLSAGKPIGDIKKVLSRTSDRPGELLVFVGSAVSDALRKKIEQAAAVGGVSRCRVFSGAEFEEELRMHAGSLLRRFFAGEALPDDPLELRTACATIAPDNEGEALSELGRLFARPAFTTPIHQESSLPAFHRAISDTIEAINTGIWRARDGTVIRRSVGRFDFALDIQARLGELVQSLEKLRGCFDDGLRSGAIRPCGCGQPDCPTFMIDPHCCARLERARDEVMDLAVRTVGATRH